MCKRHREQRAFRLQTMLTTHGPVASESFIRDRATWESSPASAEQCSAKESLPQKVRFLKQLVEYSSDGRYFE